MEPNNAQYFFISVAVYENKGLDLTLTLHILSSEDSSYEFEALLTLDYGVEIEPDLCVKDAYIQFLNLDIKKNTALPEGELDFFQAHKNYSIDEYSPIAQQLAEQVDKYLSRIMRRITFKIILKPEQMEQA